MAIVSVQLYNRYIDRARETEAMALLGAIANAQKIYYIEHGYFADKGKMEVDVDISENKYFTSFEVELN